MTHKARPSLGFGDLHEFCALERMAISGHRLVGFIGQNHSTEPEPPGGRGRPDNRPSHLVPFPEVPTPPGRGMGEGLGRADPY